MVALIRCLCRLHNFCIDRRIDSESLYPRDECDIQISNGLKAPIDKAKGKHIPAPRKLIGAGHHFDGVPEYDRRKLEKLAKDLTYPRARLCTMVLEKQLSHPKLKKKQKK